VRKLPFNINYLCVNVQPSFVLDEVLARAYY